ncbi:alpha/beta fold hydrolase [Rhizobium leguminosarum]|uniref:alpha/beta fold hydrolase n=1 Tax=Rhizobium leguminosarum TaxID=384 RepID=UPI0024A90E17|nr:alpha/beta hydrolase [Rhizobium leguminosarum]MDI5929414.1 alpha/beta hydrolase [Rhizobium leguminosarum]
MNVTETSKPVPFSEERTISTTHGPIALFDLDGPATPIVTIHANSVSKASFVPQYGTLRGRRRVIAIDLPGHGGSANAIDPQRSYNIPGYADAIHDVLRQFDINDFIVVGHPLGGMSRSK